MPKAKVHEVKVTVDIRPGPASPAQLEAWDKFWQQVISETSARLRNERTEWNKTEIQNSKTSS